MTLRSLFGSGDESRNTGRTRDRQAAASASLDNGHAAAGRSRRGGRSIGGSRRADFTPHGSLQSRAEGRVPPRRS